MKYFTLDDTRTITLNTKSKNLGPQDYPYFCPCLSHLSNVYNQEHVSNHMLLSNYMLLLQSIPNFLKWNNFKNCSKLFLKMFKNVKIIKLVNLTLQIHRHVLLQFTCFRVYRDGRNAHVSRRWRREGCVVIASTNHHPQG